MDSTETSHPAPAPAPAVPISDPKKRDGLRETYHITYGLAIIILAVILTFVSTLVLTGRTILGITIARPPSSSVVVPATPAAP